MGTGGCGVCTTVWHGVSACARAGAQARGHARVNKRCAWSVSWAAGSTRLTFSMVVSICCILSSPKSPIRYVAVPSGSSRREEVLVGTAGRRG